MNQTRGEKKEKMDIRAFFPETMSHTSTSSDMNVYTKKKIDLKNSQPINISKMTNLKSQQTRFGTTGYFNTASKEKAKLLKSQNKYYSPLSAAVSHRQSGDFTIKWDEEKGIKTWTKYLNLGYDDLVMYAWGKNEHFYEIVPIDHPFKLYFDIDKRYSGEDNVSEIMNELSILCKDILKIELGNGCYIARGDGEKDGDKYVSFHIVQDGKYFRNMDECKMVMKHFQYLVSTDDRFTNLRDGVLDFNVYKNNQAFKLPFQSKAFKSIIQKPLFMDGDDNGEGKPELKNFLLTHLPENPEFYDTSTFANIDIQPKKIKTKSGSTIEVGFDEAIVLKAFTEHIGESYEHPKPSGSKTDGLPYYLASIPNPPSCCRCGQGCGRKTKFAVKCCVARISDGSDEGFDLYWNWLNTNNLDRNEEYSHYKSLSTDRGWGWKMLFNLARIYNKYIEKNDSIFDPLFNHEPTYPCETKTINSRYIECDDFSFEHTLINNDIINIRSPMGTGKSYTLHKIFQSGLYKSILYMSCKRAFAASMGDEFECDGFVNYMDVEYKEQLTDYDRVICSIESIHYCRKNYDLVIFDESESLCDNLTGQMFIKNQPLQGAERIYDIVRQSRKVLLMDAYLCRRSFNFIKDILKDLLQTKKCFYLINEFKYPTRTYIETNKNGFIEMLKKKLAEGKRCGVVCGSKNLCDSISIECAGYESIIYSARNPLPIGTNVNEAWSKNQLLVYSPTITAGISYDPKDKDLWYDYLFVYCVNKGSCGFRDTIQAHKRIRNFKESTMYLCINDNFKGHKTEVMPLTLDQVADIEVKYKLQLFNDPPATLQMMDKLDWIYNINIHNKLEKNVSDILLRGFAKKYLYLENIIPEDTYESFEEFASDIDEWEWDSIELISHDKRAEIEYRQQDKSVNRVPLEDSEVQEFMKYDYYYEYIKENTPDDIKKAFFNEFYQTKELRDMNRNVRSFKKTIAECAYDFKKFNEYRELKMKDGVMPLEYMETFYLRQEHIFRFFDKLGFIHPDNPSGEKLSMSHQFKGKDLEQFISTYKDTSVEALNILLRDGRIRRATDKIGSVQIKSIFNQLLKDEFGMEIVGKGYKYETINGKKKKHTLMAIENDVEKPNDMMTEDMKKEVKQHSDKMRQLCFNKLHIHREGNEPADHDGHIFLDEDDDE
jgi:hypothetical protein